MLFLPDFQILSFFHQIFDFSSYNVILQKKKNIFWYIIQQKKKEVILLYLSLVSSIKKLKFNSFMLQLFNT